MARRGKFITVKGTIREALDAGEFEGLTEEIVEWRESMSGNDMEHLPKFEEVQECADAMESAELHTHLEALLTALDDVEGQDAVPACEHVEGRACERCGWDGKAKTRGVRRLPKLEEWGDKGEDGRAYRDNGFVGRVTHTIRVGGKLTRKSRSFSFADKFGLASRAQVTEARDNPEKIESARREMRRFFWARLEETVAANERAREAGRKVIPANKPAVEFVPALDGFDAGKAIEWSEFRKYGKQATNLSRNDRKSNAATAVECGLGEVEAMLEAHDAAHSGDESDERVEAIRDAVEECRNALSEIESVDFPGMF